MKQEFLGGEYSEFQKAVETIDIHRERGRKPETRRTGRKSSCTLSTCWTLSRECTWLTGRASGARRRLSENPFEYWKNSEWRYSVRLDKLARPFILTIRRCESVHHAQEERNHREFVEMEKDEEGFRGEYVMLGAVKEKPLGDGIFHGQKAIRSENKSKKMGQNKHRQSMRQSMARHVPTTSHSLILPHSPVGKGL